jgi:site-specific recombinase XerD
LVINVARPPPIPSRASRDTVTLRVDRRGQYRLVGARQRPLAQANRFLTAMAIRGLSRATVRAYGFDLVTLYRWLARTGLSPAALSRDHVLRYISAQQRAGAQPTTINRRLATVRLLYRFCTGRELDPERRTVPPPLVYRARRRDRQLGVHFVPRRHRIQLRVKVPRRVVEPLTRAEVRSFLRSLRRYRDLAIVYLMLLCGLRSAEVLNLRLGDVLEEDGQLRVRGKGNRERVLPLPPLLGLPVLQRMMGHADDATTLRYIQLSMADIADEYRRAVETLQRRYRDRD